jgi:glucokinase
MILAGDIGGTKTRLALFDVEDDELVSHQEETFSSVEFTGLEEIVDRFLSNHGHHVDCACFGLAGPVIHQRCQITNLPWIVDASLLAKATTIRTVSLVNDLKATAYSLAVIKTDDIIELNSGAVAAEGNRAVIAAGTGLGEAGLYWNGRTHEPFAAEGGHADFSPRDELEIELLRFLLRQYAHVSWERVVSGPGLINIYRFLCEREPFLCSKGVARELMHSPSASVISQAALEQRCPVCEKALKLFVSLYGAEAGNLALKIMATGGLYIAGGIAPKIINRLRDTKFVDSMASKGRFQPLLEKIPVRVVMTERAALLGAAYCARHLNSCDTLIAK